jgi:hypothetical protein
MSGISRSEPSPIRRALDLAGEDLRDQKILGEIMLHAGRTFLRRYSWSDDGNRITADISFDGKHGLVRQAAERAGRSVGLPDPWLERFLPGVCGDEASAGSFPTGMYPSWERPGLRVVVARHHLVVPIMFLAGLRPMEGLALDDLEPAVRAAAEAGIKTAGRLRNVVAPFLAVNVQEESELSRKVDLLLGQFEHALGRFGGGVALRMKPKSLADVSALGREEPDNFQLALLEFENAFYAERDEALLQGMLDPEPVPIGTEERDALIGAVAEHLAQRWNLVVPTWSQRIDFLGGSRPYFRPDRPLARDIQIIETPPAFRRRLLFTGAEPLMNAKFPHEKKPRMPFWT